PLPLRPPAPRSPRFPYTTLFRSLRGPRLVVEIGAVLMGAGLLLATLVHEPWQLYLTLGALVGGGVNCLAYTGQSLYLTNSTNVADRKSTRLNSSHSHMSYAVFCL